MIAGLITAAGMSQRMGAFKPLCRAGDKPLIAHAVLRMRAGGCDSITVVVGNRGVALEDALKGLDVRLVENADYRTTGMFESFLLGLNAVDGADALFFQPCDVPLIQPWTYRRLLEARGADAVIPAYKGVRGHPVLIRSRAFGIIRAHDGKLGLRGALDKLGDDVRVLDLPDPGVLIGANTPEELERLRGYNAGIYAPERDTCMEILKYFSVLEQTVAHCELVARVAMELADRLIAGGHRVDERLVLSAALLHDVAKGNDNHAALGAKWLRELGYERVANCVAAHNDLSEESVDRLDEKAIVYLADKCVKRTELVSVQQRFDMAREKYAGDLAALAAVERRREQARRLMDAFVLRAKVSAQLVVDEVASASLVGAIEGE